jgi:hypothetical protein
LGGNAAATATAEFFDQLTVTVVGVAKITTNVTELPARCRATRCPHGEYPFGGYKIEIILHDQAGVIFVIERRAATLTVNRAHYDQKCRELTLKTRLVLLPEEDAAIWSSARRSG